MPVMDRETRYECAGGAHVLVPPMSPLYAILILMATRGLRFQARGPLPPRATYVRYGSSRAVVGQSRRWECAARVSRPDARRFTLSIVEYFLVGPFAALPSWLVPPHQSSSTGRYASTRDGHTPEHHSSRPFWKESSSPFLPLGPSPRDSIPDGARLRQSRIFCRLTRARLARSLGQQNLIAGVVGRHTLSRFLPTPRHARILDIAISTHGDESARGCQNNWAPSHDALQRPRPRSWFQVEPCADPPRSPCRRSPGTTPSMLDGTVARLSPNFDYARQLAARALLKC